MRNGYCQFWFEKQLEGWSPRDDTSVDVCAHGAIAVAEALVWARQHEPQFPLRPYMCLRGDIVVPVILVSARCRPLAIPIAPPHLPT